MAIVCRVYVEAGWVFAVAEGLSNQAKAGCKFQVPDSERGPNAIANNVRRVVNHMARVLGRSSEDAGTVLSFAPELPWPDVNATLAAERLTLTDDPGVNGRRRVDRAQAVGV